MHVFVFYDVPQFNVALQDKFYAIEGEYVDSITYSLKTFYWVPSALVKDPDDVTKGTPLVYLRAGKHDL